MILVADNGIAGRRLAGPRTPFEIATEVNRT
jgi:hypothetical protein